MYSFDFERYFYPNPDVEKAERGNYYKTLEEFENFRGKVTASPDYLLRAFQLYDMVLVEFMRHYTYHYLRYAINTVDVISKTISMATDVEFTTRTSFLQTELISIDEPTLDLFIKQKPELEAYRFAVESAQRYRPHTLNGTEESLLSRIEPVASQWEYDLYETLVKRTVFGYVNNKDTQLDVLRQRLAIASHPEPAVRSAGFKKLYAGYASQRDLYAFALINLVRARNQLARMHHFEDATSEIYFNSFWTKAEVTNLLEQIGGEAGVYQGYQRLRAGQAKHILGVGEVNLWDIPAYCVGETPPKFAIDEASRIICEALTPLGSEYGSELANLLDPVNRRMDILPGDHRKSGGFSKGFPGVTTMFFSSSFEGLYNDMRVLMHESTHAIHRQLMNNHAVRAIYADGPHYLFESFAILNELLLADYLYGQETDLRKRRYYLEQFLEGKGMALFFITQDASLEQDIYEEVKQGRIETADDLDALTERNNSRFDIWIGRHPELKMRWITNRLFYEDPLYNINYVYGSLLALKYYAMFTESPGTFVENYIALMRNGFDAPPVELLKKFLKIDLNDPQLIDDAVQILDHKVVLLGKYYSGERGEA